MKNATFPLPIPYPFGSTIDPAPSQKKWQPMLSLILMPMEEW
jgi:hypothetical protein